MKELYKKIMASEELQKKVMAILAEAEEKGEEATKEALVSFAKEQGCEVTFEEIKEFLESIQEDGELTDDELDMVAGGKGKVDSEAVLVSVLSVGLECAAQSAAGAMAGRGSKGCKSWFYK